MAFRFVSSGGALIDPAVINVAASGVVKNGALVDFIRTGGLVVGPSGTASTSTMIFGVCQDYAQGASDVMVKVVPVDQSQIWEADCANAATTAQVGIRHAMTANTAERGLLIHNTATDVNANAGIFLALGMTSLTTGSGKLIGRILSKSQIESYSGGL